MGGSTEAEWNNKGEAEGDVDESKGVSSEPSESCSPVDVNRRAGSL